MSELASATSSPGRPLHTDYLFAKIGDTGEESLPVKQRGGGVMGQGRRRVGRLAGDSLGRTRVEEASEALPSPEEASFGCHCPGPSSL
jgi:hypothetical protein